MDKLIILSKIDSLKRCIERIKGKQPKSVDELESNLDRQDIIVLNLERAVQICVDIAAIMIAEKDFPTPVSMAECFDSLNRLGVIDNKLSDRMRKSVGFRNVAVLQYQNIDWNIVFAIIKTHLVDFQHFAKQIISWLDTEC